MKKKANLVEDFLELYPRSRRVYGTVIKKYFDFVKQEPENYIVDVRILDKVDRIKQMNIYENDIISYVNYYNKKVSAGSVDKYYRIVKQFFKNNRIEFDSVIWAKINRTINYTGPITKDKALTFKEIKEVLTNANMIDRSFFMVLATSGMRIGELTQIQMEDIDFDKSPHAIHIKAIYTKKQRARTTFMSDEAYEYFEAYLLQRDKYLKKALKRAKQLKKPKAEVDDTVFPLETQTFAKHWIALLKKSGYDEKSEGRFVYHAHTLRKSFRNNFVRSTVERVNDIKNLLMGHEGYMDVNYLRGNFDELRKAYDDSQSHLYIFKQPYSSKETEAKFEKINREKKELEKRVEMLESDWYEQRKEGRVIIDAIHPDTGEHYFERDKPDTERYSKAELLKMFINEKREMRAIKRLGIDTWVKLKRLELLEEARKE